MDSRVLQRFLAGKASPQEEADCEAWLEQAPTLINCDATVDDNSLISALQSASGNDELDDSMVESIVNHLVERMPLSDGIVGDLQSWLGPAVHAGDLGTIGPYRVIELLACGGMGLVFRGVDPKLNRSICIKLLNPVHRFHADTVARFERESREAAQLAHDRIVMILDVGEQNGLPWFAMPMLSGQSLRRKLQNEGSLSPALAQHYIRQMVDGLDYAHQSGLLHRDIKPDNVWITDDDELKILDFGLARTIEDPQPLTHSGTLIGTPSYMSPEQVQGHALDPRSDLFSVGVVWVEMLTGANPFRRSNLISSLLAVANEPMQRQAVESIPGLSSAACDLILDLLAVDPNRRLKTAREMICRLDRLDDLAFAAPPRKSPGKVRRWQYALAGMLAGLILTLAGLAANQWSDKGILVVEASDPDVEVRIAGEKVTVVDPQTHRTFEVQVGATPLPSGVYQLEATDSSGDLVFSSQSITIRRGERVIVRVELRPRAEPIPTPADSKVAESIVEDSELAPDASFDLAAREQFGELRWSLPALPIFEKEVPPGSPLTPFATVQQPHVIHGITSWSIEGPDWTPQLPSWNCNGNLRARSTAGGFIEICDEDDRVRHLLPTTGRGASATFDTRYPDLLAVTSYIEPSDKDQVPIEQWDRHRYEVTVWRLGDGLAELIYRLPKLVSHSIAWDSGYRLAILDRGQIQFVRLDTGAIQDALFIGDAEHFSSGAVSPNGRYLVTRANVGQHLNVWDLHRQMMLTSLPYSGGFRWNSDSSQIAVMSRSGNYQFWRIGEAGLLMSVELSPASATRSNEISVLAHVLEDNFQRVAWINRDGLLTVRQLADNRQASWRLLQRANTVNTDEPGEYAMKWESDGTLQIRSPTGIYRWTSTTSDLHGVLTLIQPLDVATSGPPTRLDISPKMVTADHGLVMTFKSLDKLARRDRLVRFNLQELNMGNVVNHDDRADPLLTESPSFSPNGRFRVLRQHRNGRLLNPTLTDLEFGGDGVALLPANRSLRDDLRIQTTWSRDSRYLVYSTSQPVPGLSARSLALPHTYDTQTGETRTPEWVADLDVSNAEHRDGWMLVPQSSSYCWLDPTTGHLMPLSHPPGFNLDRLVCQNDDLAIFTGTRVVDEGEQSSPKRRCYVKTRMDHRTLVVLDAIDVDSPFPLAFSADGEFIFHKRYLNYEEREFRGKIQIVADRSSTEEISISTWKNIRDQNSDVLYQTSSQRLSGLRSQWHSLFPVAMWVDDYQGVIQFFNAENCSLTTIPDANGHIIDAPFGWLISNRNSLIALNPSGELIGKLFFDRELVDEAPAHPRWVFADGSVCQDEHFEKLIMTYVRDHRVMTMTLEDYLQQHPQPWPRNLQNFLKQ